MTLTIPTIDCSKQDPIAALAELRRKLSPQGDIVSEAGKQRTIALFGEPLAPRQVVQRICADVCERGLAAVLEYTAKLDGKELTRDTMRVSTEELAAAHAAADPKFLQTLRRIIGNISEFQSRILHEDVRLVRQDGTSRVELRQRSQPLRRVGICVPGGAAAYPTTVLMTAVPA
ncbi:MAG: histidinol dehydrogenase, partial [Candidatus Saccharimonas sp.]|nr:histidinol dehydrogenase [Planctomycetaceae bacterium]